MLYPVYVHPGDAKHAHGVTFPDFPGCFAAADDWAGLPAAIQESVQAHFHGEGAEAVPAPTALEVLAADPQYSGGVWLLADVDLSRIDTSAVRPDTGRDSRTVRSTYHEADDILVIRLSDKPITREVSQDWNTHVSYAEDGTAVEVVLLGVHRPAAMSGTLVSGIPDR